MPSVWMRVLNLPRQLRTYEVLWAIGTMFGATQRVDMITTRKNTFGRYKISCLNPAIVPTQMDVVIGTRFFELQFEIEPTDNNTAAPVPARKKNGNGEDGANQEQHKSEQDSHKKQKNVQGSAAETSETQQPANETDTSQSNMQEDELVDDLDEDDLLDEEWEVRETDDGQVTVHEILQSKETETGQETLGKNFLSAEQVYEMKEPEHVVSKTTDMNFVGEGQAAENITLMDNSTELVKRDELAGDIGNKDGMVGLPTAGVESSALFVASNRSVDAGQDGLVTNTMDQMKAGDAQMLDKGSSDAGNMPILGEPSVALGPLLEKALKELKEPKVKAVVAEDNDSTWDKLVTVPVNSPTTVDGVSCPLRRSVRRQHNVDEDTSERASRLVAKKNLEVNEDEHTSDNIKNIEI
ncbi:hypothetical protein EJB05_30423, partial [Eragrostis curvula]